MILEMFSTLNEILFVNLLFLLFESTLTKAPLFYLDNEL